ncbi:MAG: hypothetical protein Q8N18_18295 [Opitutaceae bacterium]|nr:hypothetical protein [Opitutaceae bacterium]
MTSWGTRRKRPRPLGQFAGHVEDEHPACDYIPNPLTVYQIKSGKISPEECAAEIFVASVGQKKKKPGKKAKAKKAKLKPAVADAWVGDEILAQLGDKTIYVRHPGPTERKTNFCLQAAGLNGTIIFDNLKVWSATRASDWPGQRAKFQ